MCHEPFISKKKKKTNHLLKHNIKDCHWFNFKKILKFNKKLFLKKLEIQLKISVCHIQVGPQSLLLQKTTIKNQKKTPKKRKKGEERAHTLQKIHINSTQAN